MRSFITIFGRTHKYEYDGVLVSFKSMTKYDESYLHKNEYDKVVVFCRTKAVSQFLGVLRTTPTY